MNESTENLSSGATSATCQHYTLQVMTPFDQPTPIECIKCNTPFDLPGALQHIRLMEERREADRVRVVDQEIESTTGEWLKAIGIYIGYPLAEHKDCDTGEDCFAIPDLNIDQAVDVRMYTPEVFLDFLHMALEELEENGQFPPLARNFDELKEAHPSYADWEWKLLPVDVTRVLESKTSKSNDVR